MREKKEEKKRRVTNRILRILNKKGEILQKDLHKTLNVSRTMIYHVLKDLESKGIIEKEEAKVKGRICRKIKLKKEAIDEKDKSEAKTEEVYKRQEVQEVSDVLFILLSKLGFPENFLELIKESGYKLEEVIYHAVRDWAIRNGFGFGNISTVYNIPIVPSEDVIELTDHKDSDLTTRIIKRYRVKGFEGEFEDAFSFKYTELNLEKACMFAKTMWDNNRRCIIVKQPKGYRLLVETYDILKDPKIGISVRDF